MEGICQDICDKRDKLVGEVLLAAAFIVYGGLYDQKVEILLKHGEIN